MSKIHDRQGRKTCIVTEEGQLNVTSAGGDRFEQLITSELFSAAALGLVPGMAVVNKFGMNPDVSTATAPQTVWNAASLYPWQVVTYTLEIVSTDADDAAPAGNGLRSVTVEGLDANWQQQSADVDLNGVGIVAIAGTWRRVNRVFGTEAGTTLSNEGTIIVRRTGAGPAQAAILAGIAQTQQAVYTIPAGKTGLLMDYSAEILQANGAPEVTYGIFTLFNDIADRPFRQRLNSGLSSGGSSAVPKYLTGPLALPEKTDVELRLLAVGANNVAVSGSFTIILVDD